MSTSQRPRRLLALLAVVVVLGAGYLALAAAVLPQEGSRQVVLYATDWCPYCRSLRILFDTHHIDYVERDVEHSALGAVGFLLLGGRGVPVTVVGPRVVYGYDLAALQTALGEIGHDVELIEPDG